MVKITFSHVYGIENTLQGTLYLYSNTLSKYHHMKVQIEEFFKPLKLNAPPSDKDYRKAKCYVQVADAFARAAHQSVYIIDYYKKGFLYVSNNPLFLCGETPGNVCKMGYGFYEKYVHLADLKLLLEINEAGFDFYYKLPVHDRLYYSIAYDFRLQKSSNHFIMANHKLTPLALDAQDNVWLALCVVTHSSAEKPGNIIISKKGSNKIFEYSRIKKEWITKKRKQLTPKEKSVLSFCVQGLTMCEIADKLRIAEVTVRFHKKNIFNKLNVKNIAEAISCATNHNLFE